MKTILFLLILTPAVWFLTLNPTSFIKETINVPHLIQKHKNEIFSSDRLYFLLELRGEDQSIVPRLFYNKGTILLDEAFRSLNVLSPKTYFWQETQDDLPSIPIEFIPLSFLPLMLLGIKKSVDSHKSKIFLLFLLQIALTGFVGVINIIFLLPAIGAIVYFTNVGFHSVSTKYKTTTALLLVFYSLFLLGRFIYV